MATGEDPAIISVVRDPVDEFNAFFTAQKRRLFTVALGVLRDRGEAEDALQETMWKAWRSWDTVRDESRREAWITRVCVNQCLSTRRRKLRLVPVEDVADVARVVDGGAVHRGATVPHVVDVDLERAFGRLSDRQRAVVLLHHHLGYTVDECAELMGCRNGTARSHLQRALASLREELRDD